MRRKGLLLAVMLMVGTAGMVPARSGPGGFLTFDYCTGDGFMQIFSYTGSTPIDDVFLVGDVGCYRNGHAYPVHIDTIPAASTVGAAGGCGPDGVEAPLKGLRLRTKMVLTYGGKKYNVVRTWTGSSTGDFPGSNIAGRVRDPSGVVALGRFRFEPNPSFYCAYDLVSIRMWDIVVGPSPGT